MLKFYTIVVIWEFPCGEKHRTLMSINGKSQEHAERFAETKLKSYVWNMYTEDKIEILSMATELTKSTVIRDEKF